MAASSDRLAAAFGLGKRRQAESHAWGTVQSVNSDGSAQILLNGANAAARAACLYAATAGDRVLCLISNGAVIALGKSVRSD